MTSKLAAALDRTKVSDRKASFLLAATAQSLGHNISEFNINRSSIQRARRNKRIIVSNNIKEKFKVASTIVVHWDGKLLQDLTGKNTIDRLPIIVTGGGIDQLLGVPKPITGTGKAQALAIADLLKEWNIVENVGTMCFDTTPANTGDIRGTCTLLEQNLKKSLLHLACWHHIIELVLKAAFEETMKIPTSGPDVPIFKSFQSAWLSIDQSRYVKRIDDSSHLEPLAKYKDDVLAFCIKQLQVFQPRADYRELLELVITFLGGKPASFKFPGAIHHARWMVKAVYSLKMYMVSEQFHLTAAEKKMFRDICLFLVCGYIKTWFTSTQAITAPANDLQFLKNLEKLEEVIPNVTKVAKKKFLNHLWYLSEELIGLAFFDKNVATETKTKMVKALNENTSATTSKRRLDIRIDKFKKCFVDICLEDLITQNTMSFFEMLEIPNGFLNSSPETWETNADYLKAYTAVTNLKVVNDHAERGVALVEEYNQLITKDEAQFQYLLQVVKEHRRRYPDCKNDTLQVDV